MVHYTTDFRILQVDKMAQKSTAPIPKPEEKGNKLTEYDSYAIITDVNKKKRGTDT